MAAGENKLIRRRLIGAWLSTVISISLVLLLVGVAGLLVANARSISDYFKENMQVSVLMKQEVGEDEAMEYVSELDAMPFIKSTMFVSREQGTKEMAELLGEDFLNVFETAPIPVSVDVTLRADYVSSDSLEVVKKKILSSPLVDEVVYQQSLVDKLNTNLRKISAVLGIFIVLLLFISFVLINNTVRLNVFSRRFTIHTMKLVGATKSFIRTPFLVQAVFQGLFSALLAILMLVGILFFVRSEFVQLFEVFRLDLLLIVIGVVMMAGVVICTVSTAVVVGHLVSLSKDELYC
ncbi:MAG TPA: cell division protein FtsX [Rikenellaceae bacterium]|nr:cell division protein FtsX [Rikenellaceae bacterium]